MTHLVANTTKGSQGKGGREGGREGRERGEGRERERGREGSERERGREKERRERGGEEGEEERGGRRRVEVNYFFFLNVSRTLCMSLVHPFPSSAPVVIVIVLAE